VCCLQSDGTDVLRVSFNTPGSRVDRELTTEFQLDRQQRQMRLDVKTPWKKVNLRGSLVNEAALKKALLSATLDETTEYSITAELQVTCHNLVFTQWRSDRRGWPPWAELSEGRHSADSSSKKANDFFDLFVFKYFKYMKQDPVFAFYF